MTPCFRSTTLKSTLILSAALALALPALLPREALAQATAADVDGPKKNTRGAMRAEEAKKHAATNQAPLYPNATRESPKQEGSKAAQKQMDELLKLQGEDNNEDKMIAKADEILANPGANAFDKSSAAYLAGAAWQGKDAGGYENAIKYYKLAIDGNGLHNNNHYRAMLQLAQLQDADEKHADALATIDRFLTETKSEDETALKIKTQILLGMDKPAEAAALLEKASEKNPGDKKTMINLASLYVEANEDAKAYAIYKEMRAGNMFTEQKDYESGFAILSNLGGHEKDVMALIEEGEKKGVLQPTYPMYSFIGHQYYDADNIPKAIEYWNKGAPMSKDGEMYLNVAKLQVDDNHFAEAKEAAMQAKTKGVKKVGDAWVVIARAEKGLGNAAAATAATREAAKYPESRKWAESVLGQGSKK
jgi:hypothetical protein